MAAGGKGHTQRPTDPDKFADGYERIWGNKQKPEPRKDAEPAPKDE